MNKLTMIRTLLDIQKGKLPKGVKLERVKDPLGKFVVKNKKAKSQEFANYDDAKKYADENGGKVVKL